MSSSFPLNTSRTVTRLSKPPDLSSSNITLPNEPLDASRDARQIVRFIQCPKCSCPLREPVTMPCGNTICKGCIPEFHLRSNISYPMTPNRLQGFRCPVVSCRKEHAAGDCSIDVVLNRIMDVVRKEITTYKGSLGESQGVVQIEEKDKWSIAGIGSLKEEPARTYTLQGGRLAAAFTMAEMGQLAYDSEVKYTPVSPLAEKSAALDVAVLGELKEAARSELDCHVCYALFLDPLTTACGHTLCRSCLHRVQDHSNLCPICRRVLALPPGVRESQAPSNIVLSKLLAGLCPEALAARIETAKLETSQGDLDTPLFVCTLSFPMQPTFLHVFEPRYRLMIRRAMETNRKFGMLLSNRTREVQGDLGRVPFYQYGTMLLIVNMHVMPDGRSIIESVGISRFRVLRHGILDGYLVGKVERVDDMSIAEEEAVEAEETSSSLRNFPAEGHSGAPPHNSSIESRNLDALSTQELFEIGTRFVKNMRETSAAWLHHNVVQAYGECPDDPALFPWWFASIVPTNYAEKYKMLMTSSVRERLKMCVTFAAELEKQNRTASSSSSCTVF